MLRLLEIDTKRGDELEIYINLMDFIKLAIPGMPDELDAAAVRDLLDQMGIDLPEGTAEIDVSDVSDGAVSGGSLSDVTIDTD